MSFANSHSAEGTLMSTSLTITFPWPARQVQITNDSSINSLEFKLNASETYRTLKPYETATLENVRMPEVYINSDANVAYRVWGLG